MEKHCCIRLAVVGLLLTVRPASGHHAFSAEFDREQPIRIDGTITRVDWTSPHVYVFMDVKDAAGNVANWKVEFGRPEPLEEQGWSQLGLTPGANVTVHGWKATNGGPHANAESITRDGGIRLSAASSYHGDRGGTGGSARLSSGAQPVGTTGELPGTATPLTLIGLIGLLSATAAAAVRRLSERW